jgi:predicted ATP-grasp superfamily ATP-dependent carboligase
VRALVTEVGERGALEACRGLHAAGYAVSGVAPTRLAPGHWSRSVELRLRLPDPREDEAGFVGALAGALRETRHDVLLPGGEGSMLAISRRRELLGDVPHGLPPDEVVDRALDKVALLEAAEASGLAPPPSRVCTTTEEARAAARSLRYPVVVKPPRSIVRTDGRMQQQAIAIAEDEEALESAAAGSARPFIVQRFETEAVRVSCAGVRLAGELRALAVARFQRMWPPRAGAASSAETIEPPPGLVTRVEALLDAIGWEGIFEVEVLGFAKGRFATMDLNPRVFGWMALAGGAGANLAAIWCNALRGSEGPVTVARPGVAYRWEDAELLHVLRRLRAGEIRKAAKVLRPRKPTVYGYGRWRDPAPLAARLVDAAVRNLDRR